MATVHLFTYVKDNHNNPEGLVANYRAISLSKYRHCNHLSRQHTDRSTVLGSDNSVAVSHNPSNKYAGMLMQRMNSVLLMPTS